MPIRETKMLAERRKREIASVAAAINERKEKKKIRFPRLKVNHWGEVEMVGLRSDYAKYESDISSGKIPCPFTVEFRDTRGVIVSTNPIPLKSNGKPKIDLFT